MMTYSEAALRDALETSSCIDGECVKIGDTCYESEKRAVVLAAGARRGLLVGDRSALRASPSPQKDVDPSREALACLRRCAARSEGIFICTLLSAIVYVAGTSAHPNSDLGALEVGEGLAGLALLWKRRRISIPMVLRSCLPFCFVALAFGCSAAEEPPFPIQSNKPGSPSPGEPGSGPSSGGPSGGIDSEPGGIIVDGPGGGPIAVPEGCGNGVLDEGEFCDDGNTIGDDGCPDCRTITPGYSCAAPGQPCQPIARCGDGIVAASEQCDDLNVADADGCNNRCKIELGKKCEGQPSVCTDAQCGDGVVEGAEACDDGNSEPFDGCSALCLREPDCSGSSCTSECGDGLLINEDCDDGNTIDGDGCSSTCTIEAGFACVEDVACELINGECAIRVPSVFRDFTSHEDFLPAGTIMAARLMRGLVEPDLDAEGRPVLAPNGGHANAFISSPTSFAQWYRDGAHASTLVSELVLFDNGRGGFVNRFDNQGTYFTSTGGANEESYPGGASLAACEESCRGYVLNEDFNAGCNNFCNPLSGAAQSARDQLQQANDRLRQAIDQYGPIPEDAGVVPAEILTAQEDVSAAEAALDSAEAEAASCADECEAGVEAGTAACAATCLPCSNNPDTYCTGGETVQWEGTPLFFPVDALATNLRACTMDGQQNCARVPAQYGYDVWPFEHNVFPGATEHNFHFTSEVQYWFQYKADTNATLDFSGDDDVWVFLIGKLAVDIGGVHVPINGSVTLNAGAGSVSSEVVEPGATVEEPPLEVYTADATAADFGLQEGNVYKITIFHAERQPEGSSFKLTLSGFEARPSDCMADCGDGILSFGEECDDGDNDGGYGECGEGCRLSEFCGDGVVNGPEECDGGESCSFCRRTVGAR